MTMRLLPRLPTVAARLQWARTQADMTQDELAKASGVTRDIIAKTEAGITRMPKAVESIAKSLDVPPAWLAFGHEEIDAWDEDTIEIAAAYNRLPQGLKEAVRELVSRAAEKPH